MHRATLLASALLLLLTLGAAWRYSRRLKPVELVPTLTGQPEYCLTCHADLAEISPSHPAQTFGCVACHGGERLALDANLAHSTMRGGRNPSDLSVVEASCGESSCHSGDPAGYNDHIQRVMTSLQATYAGAIANILYTYGAEPDLTARYGIHPVEGKVPGPGGVSSLARFDSDQFSNPSILAFAGNCLNCHLSAQPPSGPEYAHLTGCAACHTPTAGTDLDQPVHKLTIAISYAQCNTCHNRGNYDLRDMHFQPRTDQPTDRLHDYYQLIAQFTRCEWTLDCIDCHTRQEVMGDGVLHSNQKEMEYVRCYTCHGTLTDLPLTYRITDPNDIALRQAFLNPVVDLKVGDTILVTEKGEPLWNIQPLPDGTYEEVSKATGQRFIFKPVKGSGCLQNPDQQESRYCHECHSVER